MKETNRDFIKHRLEKARELKEAGINPYSNDFNVLHTSKQIKEKYAEKDKEYVEAAEESFSVAGRVMSIRDFGKSSFFSIKDRTGQIQGYIQKNIIGSDKYEIFKKVDIGDFIGIKGRLFLTRSGELTIQVKSFHFLTKSILPLPEKWHGLQDVELRYRQRYVDLIVNDKVKEIFITRAKIVSMLRKFLTEHDFLEVETPMMQQIAGGAAAQPFKTHHNALNVDLYLRIAPELYLKRLLVGGLERVFEINRNFRNEGISTQHNPEFTMLEFYQAYATFDDLIKLTEEMFSGICRRLFDGFKFTYQDKTIDMSPPWKSMTMRECVSEYGSIAYEELGDYESVSAHAKRLGIDLMGIDTAGEALTAVFEEVCEKNLIQPTFITHYPVEVSPLARKNEKDQRVTDRFELYIAGMEVANAFSELNDPVDQRARLEEQAKTKEKKEGKKGVVDEDFLRALECGMPPAAGEGIGVDRLVMLLTDSCSIRDVILFPQLKPQRSLD